MEKTQEQARQEILDLVADYCKTYHINNKKKYEPGDRIPYASRVYDETEMVNLVDSALEFWLTSGRYTDEFEAKLAEYLGVRYCALVNSGSSANLVAFMTLTSPLLKERQVKPGDEIITVAAGFPTTVTPAIQYGAVPVFVDVTIPQYNIDVDMLEKALSENHIPHKLVLFPQNKRLTHAFSVFDPFMKESTEAIMAMHQFFETV